MSWERKTTSEPHGAIEFCWSAEEWPSALRALKELKERGRQFTRTLHLYTWNDTKLLAVTKEKYAEANS